MGRGLKVIQQLRQAEPFDPTKAKEIFDRVVCITREAYVSGISEWVFHNRPDISDRCDQVEIRFDQAWSKKDMAEIEQAAADFEEVYKGLFQTFEVSLM